MWGGRLRVRWILLGIPALLAAGIVLAASPPALTHYQAVLRGSDGTPLSGSYDMVFALFDAEAGGNEVLLDSHLAAGAGAVTAAGGLFSVALGSGQVADGSGPGSYTSLAEVFRDHTSVWLEVRIATETLAPRTRMLAAAYALNAANAAESTQLAGQPASFYLDTSATAQTKLGRVLFDNTAGTGTGIEATGPGGGGFFRSSNSSGNAYVGSGDYGISASGNTMGGFFDDADNSGYAYAGYGDAGLEGFGNYLGGFFMDLDSSGRAYLGYGDYGIQSYGNTMGGYFDDTNGSGYAQVAYGEYGIQAYGNTAGGFFQDLNNAGYAYVGNGDYGIQAFGSGLGGGGYFANTINSGWARLAAGDVGVVGNGNGRGGQFDDLDSTATAWVAYGAYKIYGSGTVSFVQNHPTRKDRVIVYAAPEGDEVAVYTRGSDRLRKGEARVALGETFALVANPDVGLTAHVTARGDVPLWVEAVSSSELVVHGPADADVAFDYIVYGLRIGFETLPIVQVKKDEAYLPTASTLAELESGQPDTVASSALARIRPAHERLAGSPADLTRGVALAAKINEGREEWLDARRKRGEEERRAGHPGPRSEGDAPPAPQVPGTSHAPTGPAATLSKVPTGRAGAPASPSDERQPVVERGGAADAAVPWIAVFETTLPIDAGDVVAVEPGAPGSVRRAERSYDTTVVGIALAPAREGRVQVAMASVVEVRVDPAYGAILAGDLLVSSPTPGAAMRATVAEPGTVIGKALEPSGSDAGVIRALAMLR